MSIEVNQLTPEGKERVEAVLSRAASDIEFRDFLLENPVEALKDTNLTEEEQEMVSRMKRVALEEWGVDVRRFRTFLLDNGNKIAMMRAKPV